MIEDIGSVLQVTITKSNLASCSKSVSQRLQGKKIKKPAYRFHLQRVEISQGQALTISN
jgi:hypothetical protein